MIMKTCRITQDLDRHWVMHWYDPAKPGISGYNAQTGGSYEALYKTATEAGFTHIWQGNRSDTPPTPIAEAAVYAP